MSIEIPDEYGLSSDSLRGSHAFVRPDLVGNDESRDYVSGRPNPRAKLSRNEILILEQNGMLVDADGYEREPEPIVQVAPIPLAQPRMRKRDNAPAKDIITVADADDSPEWPDTQSSVDTPPSAREWKSPQPAGPTVPLAPYSGTATAPSDVPPVVQPTEPA